MPVPLRESSEFSDRLAVVAEALTAYAPCASVVLYVEGALDVRLRPSDFPVIGHKITPFLFLKNPVDFFRPLIIHPGREAASFHAFDDRVVWNKNHLFSLRFI